MFKKIILSITLIVSIPIQAALIVEVAPTNGESVDLTAYSDYIHFTSGYTNTSRSEPANLNANGLPTGATVVGTAFTTATNTFRNGLGNGEISANSARDNPYAARLIYGNGPNDVSGSYWFGDWAGTTGINFSVTLPYANGKLALYAGGFTSVGGGATFSASASNSAAQTATFTNSGDFQWGSVFTVSWSDMQANDTIAVSLTNIPGNRLGNSGLIGAFIQPIKVSSPYTLSLFLIGVIAIAFRHYRKV